MKGYTRKSEIDKGKMIVESNYCANRLQVLEDGSKL